jgi:hypothetical protein
MTTHNKKWKDARNGAVLQCVEAATLGMPFEVWKTRMGRFRNETTMEAFKNVYRRAGPTAFWHGLSAKMVESASKGAVLMLSKELLKDSCMTMGLNEGVSGLLAGAGGGVCQVVVMGPCTFLVTSVVTGDKSVSVASHVANTWKAKGLLGFYPGGVAIAWRQATNWASRQGFTDFARMAIAKHRHGDSKAKLSVTEEVAAGIFGGAVSCWNQPFEIARIEAQARATAGETSLGMMGILRMVHAEQGVRGLFTGIIPRIGLSVWQTLFMVTGANLIRTYVFGEAPKTSPRH